MFYLVPLPVFFGIIVSGLIKSIGFLKKRNKIYASFLCFLVAFSLYVLSFEFKRGSVGLPNYKLPQAEYLIAKKIVKVAPEGPMLAPKPLCSIIPLLSSKFPQMRIRTDAVKLWMGNVKYGNQKKSTIRINASNFVAGKYPKENAFKKLIKHTDLESIVLLDEIWNKSNIQNFLNEKGFYPIDTFKKYKVVSKIN
jgi:hypothetical protein